MSVDIRNSEGYVDPTAHEALSAIEREHFALSGPSSTSALPMPEMWNETWPLPEGTRVLLWRPAISQSRRTCCFHSS